MKPACLWTALAFSTLVIAACNNKPDTKDDPKSPQTGTGPKAPENIKQLKELKKTDIKVGTGPAVKNGDLIYMKYTGKLKNGIQFDSNDKPDGVPYGLTLGAQEAIPGWDQGLVGMKIGGKRKLDVPNSLAYGDNERGETVPAGADLYFEVELLDAIVAGDEALFENTETKVGSGRVAKVGDMVEVNYEMRLVNGKKVDAFLDKNAPIVFRIGPKLQEDDREVPKGISAATVGMREGGTRKMRIPPAIGYQYSSNPKLPMKQIVIIEMTLNKIR